MNDLLWISGPVTLMIGIYAAVTNYAKIKFQNKDSSKILDLKVTENKKDIEQLRRKSDKHEALLTEITVTTKEMGKIIEEIKKQNDTMLTVLSNVLNKLTDKLIK